MASAKKRKPLKLNLRRGALTRKAKKAGMSVQAYAKKERNAPGRLGKQARFALTARKWHHGGARKTSRTKTRRRKRTAARR